jgi:hypothetical protein
MGPLFSAFIVLLGTALLLLVAFLVVSFFQPAPVAIRVAAIFVVGAAIGGGATGFSLSLIFPATLETVWQGIAFLASLATGVLVGGALLVVVCVKCRFLTLSTNGIDLAQR